MIESSQSAEAHCEEGYYANARSWAQDKRAVEARSRRTAWIVASVAAAVASLEGLTLIALAPLKTVIPYTVLVDRNTGFAQLLRDTDRPQVSSNVALVQSQLAQYVIARESFDIANMQQQYQKVALWSSDNARSEYLNLIPATNPNSPLNLYPRSTKISVRIESVSMTGAQSANVRFVTEQRDLTSGVVTREFWVAILHFRYSEQAMSLEDRLINPLGFQVSDYRKDQEAPPTSLDADGTAKPVARAMVSEGLLEQPNAVRPMRNSRPVLAPPVGPDRIGSVPAAPDGDGGGQ